MAWNNSFLHCILFSQDPAVNVCLYAQNLFSCMALEIHQTVLL